MALAKYGGGIVQLSGSIAGNTYARNRFGNYVRARTTPVNPNTTRQQSVRQAVADLSDRWAQTLTAAQRTAWNLYAASVVMKNRLGEDIHLTGFNHYIRSNTVLTQLVESLIDDGPTIFELPEQDPTFAGSASEATQLVSVTFDNGQDWANEDNAFLAIKMGSPQNAQRNFFGGPWRFMDQIDGDGVTPPTSPTTMAVPFPIAEGQHIWIEARVVRADGRLSEPFRADFFCAS